MLSTLSGCQGLPGLNAPRGGCSKTYLTCREVFEDLSLRTHSSNVYEGNGQRRRYRKKVTGKHYPQRSILLR